MRLLIAYYSNQDVAPDIVMQPLKQYLSFQIQNSLILERTCSPLFELHIWSAYIDKLLLVPLYHLDQHRNVFLELELFFHLDVL